MDTHVRIYVFYAIASKLHLAEKLAQNAKARVSSEQTLILKSTDITEILDIPR